MFRIDETWFYGRDGIVLSRYQTIISYKQLVTISVRD